MTCNPPPDNICKPKRVAICNTEELAEAINDVAPTVEEFGEALADALTPPDSLAEYAVITAAVATVLPANVYQRILIHVANNTGGNPTINTGVANDLYVNIPVEFVAQAGGVITNAITVTNPGGGTVVVYSATRAV